MDPYPQFYSGIGAYASFGKELAAELAAAPHAPPELATGILQHFELLGDVALRLQQMAEHDGAGAPFTRNDQHHHQPSRGNVCGTHELKTGLVRKALIRSRFAVETGPPLRTTHAADREAQPGGRVLHAGRASALMVVVPRCRGPRAYAAGVSYFAHAPRIRAHEDEQWKNDVPARSIRRAFGRRVRE